ncbi:MAG: MBL fold metallo-hydrolase [Candidatus Falkowbacteria bacterium]
MNGLELIFLGGASEIGGPFSAALYGKKFAALFGCGLEAKSGKPVRLPDFSIIKNRPEPSHVFIDHGHLDHAGGLGALVRNGIMPSNFFMSATSRDFFPVHGADTIHITIRNWCRELKITPWQLYEKLKKELKEDKSSDDEYVPIDWEVLCNGIMDGTAGRLLASEGRIVKDCVLPFNYQNVRDVEYQTTTIKAGETINVGEARVTPFNVGHIMGAFGYLVEMNGKRIFFTGDFSREATSYELVKKLDPAQIGPVDVLVINSTYACQPLEHFKSVSERFRNDLQADMAAGRRVVACGFFIDRGAKVALEVMRADLLEYLHVDGKVRDGLAIYERHAPQLAGIEKYFVSDKDSRAALIQERIKNKEPAFYLVSSGMGVEGSLSNNYIGEHLHDPNAMIYRLGWCEPGTPLDDLTIAAQNGRVVNWRGQFTKFECGVRSYQFSAHATSAEIKQTIIDFNPKIATVMVHGDPKRLEQFKRENTDLPGEIIIAENGRPYQF